MEKFTEYNLDKLVIKLQKEAYELAKEENVVPLKLSKADGILKAIEYINTDFDKKYETNLGNIICHYETPIQSKIGGFIPREK